MAVARMARISGLCIYQIYQIYLIRGWGSVFRGKSVQTDFIFLPLANNKSLRIYVFC